ncbi:MAG: LacI family DNA-binding transcriptional regulator [Fimbriimonadaceae bacterium]
MSRAKPNGYRNTLKDVAVQAGVSVMSVSLALREGPASNRVSEGTRLRVLAAARELDYRPNARARALRLQQTDIIGFYAGHGYVNVRIPFYAEAVSGLQQGCEQVGKNLLLHSLSQTADSDAVYRELVDGRVDGLVAAMPATDALAARLASVNVPIVAFADALPGVPSVLVDDVRGAQLIADHIAELRHRRVVFAVGPSMPFSGRRRQQAFVERALEYGMDVNVRVLGRDACADAFVTETKAQGATAVVAWNDVDALRILSSAQSLGLDVPGDLAITGFDGCPSPYHDPFPLTTIHLPWAEAAGQAVIVLDRLIKNQPVDAFTTLPVSLMRGATT